MLLPSLFECSSTEPFFVRLGRTTPSYLKMFCSLSNASCMKISYCSLTKNKHFTFKARSFDEPLERSMTKTWHTTFLERFCRKNCKNIAGMFSINHRSRKYSRLRENADILKQLRNLNTSGPFNNSKTWESSQSQAPGWSQSSAYHLPSTVKPHLKHTPL